MGVEDMAVVATSDSVLIMKLDRSQDVKKVSEFLKARKNNGT
nr:hypothetical protein [Parvularcula sp. IMCC14364]